MKPSNYSVELQNNSYSDRNDKDKWLVTTRSKAVTWTIHYERTKQPEAWWPTDSEWDRSKEMRAHLWKRDETSGQPWLFQEEEEGRNRHGTGYSKELHTEPQQDFKMARKHIQIFQSVNTHECKEQLIPKTLLTCRWITWAVACPRRGGQKQECSGIQSPAESIPSIRQDTAVARSPRWCACMPQHRQELNVLTAAEHLQSLNTTPAAFPAQFHCTWEYPWSHLLFSNGFFQLCPEVHLLHSACTW